MAEYRIKLKGATAESVKCMYEEYIRRKSEELAQYNADVCHKEFNIEEFATPPRSRTSVSSVGNIEE